MHGPKWVCNYLHYSWRKFKHLKLRLWDMNNLEFNWFVSVVRRHKDDNWIFQSNIACVCQNEFAIICNTVGGSSTLQLEIMRHQQCLYPRLNDKQILFILYMMFRKKSSFISSTDASCLVWIEERVATQTFIISA